jgi:hypothetical protein
LAGRSPLLTKIIFSYNFIFGKPRKKSFLNIKGFEMRPPSYCLEAFSLSKYLRQQNTKEEIRTNLIDGREYHNQFD